MPSKQPFATEFPTVDQPPLSADGRLKKISNKEVSLAGILALALYTSLLLKLPYRSPVVNSVYAIATLASFYFYLRLRLSIRMPVGMLSCLGFSIVLDIGNQYGLFSQRIASIPYDIITHFISSGLSFMPVMWLLMTLIRRLGSRLPLGFVAFFSLTTTFSLAAYYEITELIDERLLGGQRLWTPRDAVQDLAADLTGIIVAAICYGSAVRKRWRESIYRNAVTILTRHRSYCTRTSICQAPAPGAVLVFVDRLRNGARYRCIG